MWILPVTLIVSTLLGLLIVLALAWSLWAVYRVSRDPRRTKPRGANRRLIAPILILALCIAGRPLVLLFFPAGGGLAHRELSSGTFLDRPDGTRLHVDSTSGSGAGTIVLTHGWGADADMWQYARRDLAPQFRVVTWDLRGLGASGQPRDNDYSLDRMADDLQAVVATTEGPVVLAGHSIGGMINLTYARRHSGELGSKVVGIADLNSTYTNPVQTTKGASLATVLQKPVGEPLLHATIALSPVVRAFAALRYYSGVSHLQNASSSFAGTETREQLDFVSRYEIQSNPAVVARGGLAMFHWDGSDALARITVPMLLIAGDRDTTTAPEASMHMRDQVPNAQLVVASPAKHMGPLERNREYNLALAAFAKDCFARDRLESRRPAGVSGN